MTTKELAAMYKFVPPRGGWALDRPTQSVAAEMSHAIKSLMSGQGSIYHMATYLPH